MAVGGGLLVAASLPPMGFWILAFPGLVLLDRCLEDGSRAARFRLGWLFGIALLWPTIWWIHELTLPGWIIAGPALAAFLGVVVAFSPAGAGRWLALPGAWVLFEAWKGRWPFGGVPLSNLAVGQVAGPLAPIARVGGSLLVGAVTVVVAVGISAALRRSWRAAGIAAAATVAALLVAAVAPSGSGTAREIRVALVQGGGEQGTHAIDTDSGEVTEVHLAATELVDEPVDLILWPENVVHTEGPVLDDPVGDRLADVARDDDATFIFGATEGYDEVRGFRNAAIAFGPDGEVVARFEKERRVPFGEFVPLRSLIEPFAPDTLPGRDAIPGTGDAVLDTPAGTFGVVISWEVFFPDRARDAIGNGGGVLLNPTNGSSFTGTQVQGQQVASSRLRALETGRWTLQVAPTGFSAVVSPDGDVLQRTGVSEQRVLYATVEHRTGLTWAVRFADWPTLVLAALAVAGGWAVARRRPAGSDLEDHGDGAVVDEVDQHLGAEAPGRHLDTEPA
jgi:apolipoprotein N-acyltransferase